MPILRPGSDISRTSKLGGVRDLTIGLEAGVPCRPVIFHLRLLRRYVSGRLYADNRIAASAAA